MNPNDILIFGMGAGAFTELLVLLFKYYFPTVQGRGLAFAVLGCSAVTSGIAALLHWYPQVTDAVGYIVLPLLIAVSLIGTYEGGKAIVKGKSKSDNADGDADGDGGGREMLTLNPDDIRNGDTMTLSNNAKLAIGGGVLALFAAAWVFLMFALPMIKPVDPPNPPGPVPTPVRSVVPPVPTGVPTGVPSAVPTGVATRPATAAPPTAPPPGPVPSAVGTRAGN